MASREISEAEVEQTIRQPAAVVEGRPPRRIFMPAILDCANLVAGNDPADYGSLPVVIRSNQRPCPVVQFQCRIV